MNWIKNAEARIYGSLQPDSHPINGKNVNGVFCTVRRHALVWAASTIKRGRILPIKRGRILPIKRGRILLRLYKNMV